MISIAYKQERTIKRFERAKKKILICRKNWVRVIQQCALKSICKN